ncbi:MAG TPA: hypothetical protein VFQ53_27075 [Kofleriaceae bacterium]|nr:hypothetical protein [Kofleriaceae bacterium]
MIVRAQTSPWGRLVILLSCAGAQTARADATNRNLLPIGEHESLRANAGIAASSPGSVFHNPAGLAALDHPQISVSGTTLMYFRSSTDRLLELDEPIPYQASGFAPIPASLVSTYKLGSFSAATAILVPDLLTLDNRIRQTTPMASLNLLQSVRRQDLWLGGALARRLGDRVAVGLSVFGVRRSSISNTFFQVTVPAQPGTLSQVTASETVDVIGVQAILGVSIEVAPAVTVGVRVEPPFLQLTGGASVYRSQLASDGMMTTLTEIDQDDVDVHQPVPADFGLGVAIRATDALTLYADVALQLGSTYTTIDDPDLGPPTVVELDAAPRASVGFDLQLATKLTLHAGVLYNGSASGRLEEPGDAAEDYYGGAAGITWTSGRTRTGLGALVMRSQGKIVPLDAMPGDTETADTTVLGGLLTVGYLL